MTEQVLTREEEIKQRLVYKTEKLQKYIETGEIGSGLSLDATLSMSNAEHGWNRIVPAYAKFSQKWIKVYARIHTEIEDIFNKGKEFEFKHWMGFCPKDVEDLLVLRRQWDHFDWENATEEEGNTIRDFWNPHPHGPEDREGGAYWRKNWQPYIDRRDKQPLQETLAEHHSFLSAELPKMKVMLGGSAGRVLLTLQDRFAQGHAEGIYGGAWVSLIFDEDSEYPRGGVQGQCATRDEAVGLIQAVIDNMPVLKPNNNIGIA